MIGAASQPMAHIKCRIIEVTTMIDVLIEVLRGCAEQGSSNC